VFFLKHLIGEKIEGTGRRKHLPDDLKETRRYSKVKERALGRTTGRILFGRLWTCRQTTFLRETWPVHL